MTTSRIAPADRPTRPEPSDGPPAPAFRSAPGAERVLLADGAPATLAALGPDDRDALAALHTWLTPDDRRYRFLLGAGLPPDTLAAHLLAVGTGFGVVERGRLVGAAHYVPAGSTAELAVTVEHVAQHRGVGTVLVEAVVRAARADGIRWLTGDVATDNLDMLAVLADLGLPLTRAPQGPVTVVVLDLGTPAAEPPGYAGAASARAAHADAEGLRPVLAPRSVAVIGASRRAGTVGRALYDRIRDGGFTGELWAVNPHGAPDPGRPWAADVAAIGGPVDLAVLCVPPSAVDAVARECGAAGVGALLVVTAGAGSGPLRETARRYGMRLVGPNCLGLAVTDPAVHLDALFAGRAVPGTVGVAAQSGGVVVGLLADLERLGLGTSSVVSTGEGSDVAADDLLAWWARDGRTAAAVLYQESIRRPREFARLARYATDRIPVLAIRSGSSAAGARAASSHSASTATPRTVRDALYRQAGVLPVDGPARAVEALALLRWQPPVCGRRVAVVSNAGGCGVLAADACARAGLEVVVLADGTRARLARVLPPGAALAGPVDTTATVSADAFAQAVDVLRDAPEVDAVLAVGVPTDLGDPLTELRSEGPPGGAPLAVLRPGQAAGVDRLHPARPPVPAYADADAVAGALRVAADRARRLARAASPRTPDRVDPTRARTAAEPARPDAAGWLDPVAAQELLRAAGITHAEVTPVHDAEAAVVCWSRAGGPVALKAHAAGVVHKSRAGGVLLGLDSADGVRAAVRTLQSRFGPTLDAVLVQPMTPPGPEVLVGVVTDPEFGPVLTAGVGGTATDLVADRAHLLLPADPGDVTDALAGLGAAQRLWGPPGAVRDARVAAVADTADRLAWLVAEQPEIVEIEINPLVLGGAEAVAVDVRVRLPGR